jgi:hypothetical protein
LDICYIADVPIAYNCPILFRYAQLIAYNNKLANIKKMRIVVIIIIVLFNNLDCFSQSRKDESFTEKQYEKLGVPSPEKIWHSDEYDKCIVILTDVKKENIKSLPQFNSKKSNTFFQRLISPENLLIINDSTIDIQQRVFQLQYLTSNFGKLVFLYYQNDNSKEYYSKEMVELFIFGLRINEATFNFANTIMQKAKIINEQMKLGIQNMKNGYKNTIVGMLDELERNSAYNIEDLEKLSLELKNNIDRNIDWIEPNTRLEIKEKITKMTQNEYSLVVNNNLIQIIKKL